MLCYAVLCCDVLCFLSGFLVGSAPVYGHRPLLHKPERICAALLQVCRPVNREYAACFIITYLIFDDFIRQFRTMGLRHMVVTGKWDREGRKDIDVWYTSTLLLVSCNFIYHVLCCVVLCCVVLCCVVLCCIVLFYLLCYADSDHLVVGMITRKDITEKRLDLHWYREVRIALIGMSDFVCCDYCCSYCVTQSEFE
jgi:hypothetical protein